MSCEKLIIFNPFEKIKENVPRDQYRKTVQEYIRQTEDHVTSSTQSQRDELKREYPLLKDLQKMGTNPTKESDNTKESAYVYEIKKL